MKKFNVFRYQIIYMFMELQEVYIKQITDNILENVKTFLKVVIEYV